MQAWASGPLTSYRGMGDISHIATPDRIASSSLWTSVYTSGTTYPPQPYHQGDPHLADVLWWNGVPLKAPSPISPILSILSAGASSTGSADGHDDASY